MIRVGALVTVLLAGAAAALAAGAGGDEEGRYRVAAIFDNAGFLIPGQDVKIAGARVGHVVDVSLTADRKARVEMAVDPRFAPFRDDADCTIQPQSLVGEKFVQCTPGTPRGKVVRGDPPTLGVENTHAPIDADLVLAALRRPAPERLRIIVNELGAGLAGRAEELSAVIRRANPALRHTERVLAILDDDRAKLRALVAESERVVGALAGEHQAIGEAVDRGSRVAGTLAERRRDLGATLERLPALLGEARPSLERLRTLLREGEPVLGDLERAAPPLSELAGQAGPLADAARPALDRLGEAARTGGPVLRRAAPIVEQLRTFAARALPTGRLVDELFASLRDRGVVEGLQDFVYHAALAIARYDRYSHILPAHLLVTECALWAETTDPHCSANFAGGGRRASADRDPRADRRERPARRRGRAPERDAEPDERAAPPAAAPAAPAPAPAPAAPQPDPAPAEPSGLVPRLLDDLREGVGGLLPGGAGPGRTPSGGSSPPPPAPRGPGSDPDPVEGVLDFLLG